MVQLPFELTPETNSAKNVLLLYQSFPIACVEPESKASESIPQPSSPDQPTGGLQSQLLESIDLRPTNVLARYTQAAPIEVCLIRDHVEVCTAAAF